MRPKVMLFDEVTSALDPEVIGEVTNVIKHLVDTHNLTMRMQQRLRRANRAARIAQDKDIAVPARLVALIERRYDEIIAEALAFHESQSTDRSQSGLEAARPRCAVLRFLTDLEVGFTNNEAERDLRMMKLMVTHQMGFAKEICVCFFFNGAIEEQGTPDHAVREPGAGTHAAIPQCRPARKLKGMRQRSSMPGRNGLAVRMPDRILCRAAIQGE